MKKIIYIIVAVLLTTTINVYACSGEDGCVDCGSSAAETECRKSSSYNNNIKIAILGDSISTYEGYINGINGETKGLAHYNSTVMSVNETWWMRVANNKGWKVINNESIGGTTVSWDGSTEYGIIGIGKDYYMAGDSRINNIGKKGTPNKLFIFAGVNDIFSEESAYNINIGSISNVSIGNTTTFASAYATMLNKIKTKYPSTEIICLAPYVPLTKKTNTTTRTNQVSDIIINLAKKNNLRYVDLRKIKFENSDFTDGTHPSSSGMKKIADLILSELNVPIKNQTSSNNSTNGPTINKTNVGVTMKKDNTTTGELDCGIFDENTATGKYLHDIYNIIKFAVPIILLALSILDFAKAIINDNSDELKKATTMFSKRLIVAIVILIVPTILNFVLDLFGLENCYKF